MPPGCPQERNKLYTISATLFPLRIPQGSDDKIQPLLLEHFHRFRDHHHHKNSDGEMKAVILAARLHATSVLHCLAQFWASGVRADGVQILCCIVFNIKILFGPVVSQQGVLRETELDLPIEVLGTLGVSDDVPRPSSWPSLPGTRPLQAAGPAPLSRERNAKLIIRGGRGLCLLPGAPQNIISAAQTSKACRATAATSTLRCLR